VVTEVGSAPNGRRRKFLDLMYQSLALIVVEHRDGFVWFGAEYVEAALVASGRRLAMVDRPMLMMAWCGMRRRC
jgi:predicted site-specific integrase-resolvase